MNIFDGPLWTILGSWHGNILVSTLSLVPFTSFLWSALSLVSSLPWGYPFLSFDVVELSSQSQEPALHPVLPLSFPPVSFTQPCAYFHDAISILVVPLGHPAVFNRFVSGICTSYPRARYYIRYRRPNNLQHHKHSSDVSSIIAHVSEHPYG